MQLRSIIAAEIAARFDGDPFDVADDIIMALYRHGYHVSPTAMHPIITTEYRVHSNGDVIVMNAKPLDRAVT